MTTDPFDAALWRYVAGRPLVERAGVYPYLSPGDARWAGWQRQALRIGAPAVALFLLVLCAVDPGAARALVLTAGITTAWWAKRTWRRRKFRRTYITPTVKAIRVPVGTADVELQVDPGLGKLVARLAKPLSPAEEWLRERYSRWVEPWSRWPSDRVGRWVAVVWTRWVGPPVLAVKLWFSRPREQHGPRIRLTIAAPFVTAEQRSMISAIVAAKIPAGELVESWNQVGADVTATWVPRRRPPANVLLADLEAHFPLLHEWEYYLGLGAGDIPVTVSLHEDSPHIAVSAGSGAGKSVFAQLVAVQVLRRGGRVVILDRKGSHRWAVGVDGVDYCTKPEQMSDALLKAAALADERNTLAFHEPEGWDPGPRVLVICEELNATIAQLQNWWAEVRPKGGPKRCPAISALNDIAFMGRSAKVNLFAIAQMLTARALGGPEARENFGIRCLARYTVNNWKMLVPEASMPRSSRTLGRWQVVVGGTATETQVCYLTPAQARAFARVPDVAEGPDRPLTSDVAGDTPVSWDMTLREAIDEGLLPWSWDATRKRIERGVGNPPAAVGQRGQAYEYKRDDLIAWVERSAKEAAKA